MYKKSTMCKHTHLSLVLLTFVGKLADVPEVGEFAGAQEPGGIGRIMRAGSFIETRIVRFADGHGAIVTTPVTNTTSGEEGERGGR